MSNRYVKALFALAVVAFAGCSPKLRYPVEQIRRPLSLPPKNWGLSIGTGVGYNSARGGHPRYVAMDGNIPCAYLDPMFAYPYVGLFNERAELHFTPLRVKVYPVRNVVVEDSALCISGFNWALGGGIEYMTFSFNSDGLDRVTATLGAFSELKVPISTECWLFSTIRGQYTPGGGSYNGNVMDVNAKIGPGFQFGRYLYATIGAEGRYRITILPDSEFPFRDTRRYAHYSLSMPMKWGYNFNRRWKVFLFTEIGTDLEDGYFGGAGMGFDFYW
jgi:hypothetical protein